MRRVSRWPIRWLRLLSQRKQKKKGLWRKWADDGIGKFLNGVGVPGLVVPEIGSTRRPSQSMAGKVVGSVLTITECLRPTASMSVSP